MRQPPNILGWFGTPKSKDFLPLFAPHEKLLYGGHMYRVRFGK